MVRYSVNHDIELQQRAVEYSTIFSKHDNMRCVHIHDIIYVVTVQHFKSLSCSFLIPMILRSGLFERMPLMSTKGGGANLEGSSLSDNIAATPPQTRAAVSLEVSAA